MKWFYAYFVFVIIILIGICNGIYILFTTDGPSLFLMAFMMVGEYGSLFVLTLISLDFVRLLIKGVLVKKQVLLYSISIGLTLVLFAISFSAAFI